MRRIIALIVIIALLLVSCGTIPDPSDGTDEKTPSDSTEPSVPDEPVTPDDKPEPIAPDDQPDPVSPDEEPYDARSAAEILLANMTLEEKVGQLFLIRPDSLDPYLTPDQVNETYLYGHTEATSAMLDTLQKYPAGGVVFFGKNLSDPASLQSYIASLSSVSDIPLLYAVDEEGGIVSRIANIGSFGVENIGNMANIGATGDPAKAYSAGQYIGSYLSTFGLKLDFAPVADINTNPNNIVIGKRAFGSDPKLVSSMVSSFLDGLHSERTIGCIKHFPGHGDTTADTHEDYVSVQKTWEQLKEAELIPFIDNFGN
ncbi:MAG: glycoside hydrolase family 3 protein, partial [Oscillospiraceae bacterium]|nr:glycoside hydrolase family 3 protein [Oscillospiraceae bacterium]